MMTNVHMLSITNCAGMVSRPVCQTHLCFCQLLLSACSVDHDKAFAAACCLARCACDESLGKPIC